MDYTIRISDTTPQAKSIINMLESLAKDYDFLQINEETKALTNEQERELMRRHKYVIKHPTVGKTWEEIEKSL